MHWISAHPLHITSPIISPIIGAIIFIHHSPITSHHLTNCLVSSCVAVAFDIMDQNGDGALTQKEVFRFLYAFSCVLSALLFYGEPVDNERDQVWERAHAMYTQSDLNFDEDVTIEE
jgi:hypothetical protein